MRLTVCSSLSPRTLHRWMPGSGDAALDVLWVLLALILVRGVIYAVLNPPFGSPDEGDHFKYVAYLATGGASGDPGREIHQPVLYYALMAPAYWLTAGQPPAVQLLAIRLCSLPFLLGAVWVTWRTARLIDPQRATLALGAASLVALNPQSTLIAASANNDNAANLTGAVLALLAARLILRPSRRSALAVPAVCLLGLFTKGSVFPMVVLGLAALALHLTRGGLSAPAKAGALLAMSVFAGVFALQTRPGTDPLDEPRALILNLPANLHGLLSRVVEMGRWPFIYQFRTFWASFEGDTAWPAAGWYLALAALVALAAVGHLLCTANAVAAGRWRPGMHGLLYLLFACAFALQWTTSFVYYAGFLSALSFDPVFRVPDVFIQGRYLFPAMLPFSILVVGGLHRLRPRGADRWLPLCVVGLMLGVDVNSLLGLATRYTWPVQDAW